MILLPGAQPRSGLRDERPAVQGNLAHLTFAMLNNHADIDTLRVMGQDTRHVPPAVPAAPVAGFVDWAFAPRTRWAGAQTMAQAP